MRVCYHNLHFLLQDLSDKLTPLGYYLFWTQFAIGLYLFCLVVILGILLACRGKSSTSNPDPGETGSNPTGDQQPDIEQPDDGQQVSSDAPTDLNAVWNQDDQPTTDQPIGDEQTGESMGPSSNLIENVDESAYADPSDIASPEWNPFARPIEEISEPIESIEMVKMKRPNFPPPPPPQQIEPKQLALAIVEALAMSPLVTKPVLTHSLDRPPKPKLSCRHENETKSQRCHTEPKKAKFSAGQARAPENARPYGSKFNTKATRSKRHGHDGHANKMKRRQEMNSQYYNVGTRPKYQESDSSADKISRRPLPPTPSSSESDGYYN